MILIKDIIACTGAIGDLSSNNEILNALAITDANFGANSIGWCSDKNKHILSTLKKGTILVSNVVFDELDSTLDSLCLIPVDQPRLAFMKVLQQFFVDQPTFGKIHSSSHIDSSVQIENSSVSIEANVIIEANCIIGKNVVIGANTVVKANSIIEDGCKIGSNCTIGGVGFGYEQNEKGEYELMPHIGNVHLKANVEIGNNVCIDRAVMGSTLLNENVKVDNLVHIAHGVQIGKNSLIIANAMVAGSVEIGENVWVAPSSSIRQKLTIADNSLIGMGAVVVKNVAETEIVAGNPAKPFLKK